MLAIPAGRKKRTRFCRLIRTGFHRSLRHAAKNMLRKPYGISLSGMDVMQARVYAASMPCLPKIAYMRGFQGSATSSGTRMPLRTRIDGDTWSLSRSAIPMRAPAGVR